MVVSVRSDIEHLGTKVQAIELRQTVLRHSCRQFEVELIPSQ